MSSAQIGAQRTYARLTGHSVSSGRKGGERLLHEPEIGVARHGREQHEPENAHAVKRRRGYGEEDHRQQMDHRHEKRPRQIPDAEKHRVFIVFQSVFSKVAVSGNAQMNTISHSAKQTPGSTSQNSCSGKSARRMYTSAPRRASAAKQNEPEQRGFLKIIAERAEKAALFQCPDSRIMFRTAVQSAAVEAPSVKNRQRAHDPQNVQPRELRRLREKAQDGESGSKSFSYCHLRENKPIIQEQMTA